MTFRQANWNEPSIFELSKNGKLGHIAPTLTDEEHLALSEAMKRLPEDILRKTAPELPEVSEVEVVRHFTKLSQENYGVDLGIYPLGSCTMKYNPKICEILAASPRVKNLHPLQHVSTSQGILRILHELSEFLIEITGMSEVSLQPSAGAQGELCGALIIRAAHRDRNELNHRTEMIVPDSSHGTNPASAAMAGFNLVVVPSDREGCIDVEALKNVVSKKTAGMMITNPNTLGIFERRILEVAEIVHEAGGLLYYDGANLNAILGKTRPREMGFDITHINIHKTFGTPHGGGGPGAGPVGVTQELAKFLPIPTIKFDGKNYYLDYNRPQTIGKLRSFLGNISVLLRAYAYILLLGAEGLEEIAEISVLNANYLARKLFASDRYRMPFDSKKVRKHEIVVSTDKITLETGIRAVDISKRLLDFGVHAPTMYFPLIVKEAMMIEPTETESLEELDRYADILEKIAQEAYRQPNVLREAPKNTTVGRVDDVAASHPKTMCLNWRMYKNRQVAT